MIQSTLIFLSVVAAAGLMLFLFSGFPGRKTTGVQIPAQDYTDAEAGGTRYPAVSIRTFRKGCPASESLRGVRFLPEEAPPLPLPDCSWARCNCRYTHHVDRRTGNIDRRRMIGDQREYPLSVGSDDPRGSRGRRLHDSKPVES